MSSVSEQNGSSGVVRARALLSLSVPRWVRAETQGETLGRGAAAAGREPGWAMAPGLDQPRCGQRPRAAPVPWGLLRPHPKCWGQFFGLHDKKNIGGWSVSGEGNRAGEGARAP